MLLFGLLVTLGLGSLCYCKVCDGVEGCCVCELVIGDGMIRFVPFVVVLCWCWHMSLWCLIHFTLIVGLGSLF